MKGFVIEDRILQEYQGAPICVRLCCRTMLRMSSRLTKT